MKNKKETDLSVNWACNIKALIEEEIRNNSNSGALVMPWRITYALLLRVADTAIRIDDPTLNLQMCELGLYTVGDGYHKDYNPKIVQKCRELANDQNIQLKLKRNHNGK